MSSVTKLASVALARYLSTAETRYSFALRRASEANFRRNKGCFAPAPLLRHPRRGMKEYVSVQKRPTKLGGFVTLRRKGWTQEEWHKIGRIRIACRSRPDLEFAVGQTDEGDPWCVVYDRQLDQTVTHIARIGSQLIIAAPNQSKLRKPSTAQAAVNAVLRFLTRETRKNDQLGEPPRHPSANSYSFEGVPRRGVAVRVRFIRVRLRPTSQKG